MNREATVRLLTLGVTSDSFYQQARKQFQKDAEEFLKKKKERDDGGFAPPHRMSLARIGHAFARLALANFHQGNITASHLSDLLEVKYKHVARIENEVLTVGRSGAGA